MQVTSVKGRDVSMKMANFMIDELRYKSKFLRDTGMVTVYNGDVVKSDVAGELNS